MALADTKELTNDKQTNKHACNTFSNRDVVRLGFNWPRVILQFITIKSIVVKTAEQTSWLVGYSLS